MYQRNLFLFVALLCLGSVMATAQAEGQAKTAVCVACHGADGNSMNPIWPNLAGQHAEYIVAQLKAFKSGARENPSMSPMAATVADEDMAEIGAWYQAQALKIAPLGDADVSKGQELYRGGDAERGIPACMACHGPTGAGNGAARFPALRGQHAEYTALQLKAYRDGSRSTDPQSMMRTIAGRLTDDDIEQLSRYVSALH
ncbi:MAG: cytochrome c4 [Gammaproteobacteria bacterium]|nr:cytochrome c4 [Gammaproteobacteria bacterium]MCP5200454.1 cytochrome c4 [Gammaproteobacteria bacterium]